MAIKGTNNEARDIDFYLQDSNSLNDFQKEWWLNSASSSDLAKKKLLQATNKIFGRKVAKELLSNIESAGDSIKLMKSTADLLIEEKKLSIATIKKQLRNFKVKPETLAEKSINENKKEK